MWGQVQGPESSRHETIPQRWQPDRCSTLQRRAVLVHPEAHPGLDGGGWWWGGGRSTPRQRSGWNHDSLFRPNLQLRVHLQITVLRVITLFKNFSFIQDRVDLLQLVFVHSRWVFAVMRSTPEHGFPSGTSSRYSFLFSTGHVLW